MTSQPNAARAVNRCDVGQPVSDCQPAADVVADDQANTGKGEEAVEDILDTGTEELMECSSNLLNPGIRVHKYSFGFPPHALILQN